MSDPKPLIRASLAKFLPDQRAIRAFEKLFDLIPSDLENLLLAIQEAFIDAGSAEAKVVSALSLIDQLIDLIETKPPAQRDHGISTDYIDFPVDGPHVSTERRVQWNSDDGTIDVGLFGNAVLQVGQETIYYAKNDDGSNLTAGTPVMFKGTVGASGKLTFEKAVADGTVRAENMMGVMSQDIDDEEFGYITSFGIVRGIRTDGVPYGETWNDGDLLYFDPATAGTWTNVEPSAPSLKTPMAIVIYATSGNSGSIFVNMLHNEKIEHLVDVQISSVSDGDLLQYVSANSRWENVSGATGTFTTTDSKTVTVTNGIVTSIV